MDINSLQLEIEAIFFATEMPISIEELHNFYNTDDRNIAIDIIESTIAAIESKYHQEQYPFELVHSGGGFYFLSKTKYHPHISTFLNRNTVRKLTAAAIETLAIVAYKQPITKSEVEQIRGVNCDYTIQKLMERDLLVIYGRSEAVGKPLLYATSPYFLDYLGINTLDDLPKLKDFDNAENQIGDISIQN